MGCTTVTVIQAKPVISNLTGKQVVTGTENTIELSWYQDITGQVKITYGGYSWITTGTGQRTNIYTPPISWAPGVYVNICVEPV